MSQLPTRTMKYVILEVEGGTKHPVLLSEKFVHSLVVGPGTKPTSAGFVKLVMGVPREVWGESTSLATDGIPLKHKWMDLYRLQAATTAGPHDYIMSIEALTDEYWEENRAEIEAAEAAR